MKQTAAQDKRKATIPPSPFLSPSLHPILIPSSSFLFLSCIFLLTLHPTRLDVHGRHDRLYRHNVHTNSQTHPQGTHRQTVSVFTEGVIFEAAANPFESVPVLSQHIITLNISNPFFVLHLLFMDQNGKKYLNAHFFKSETDKYSRF